jgi:hypothetical protein
MMGTNQVAYVPLLTHLVYVFAEALPTRQVERLLRRTGKALAEQLAREKRISGALKSRAVAASELMNAHLGALTQVGGNRAIVIRSAADRSG